MQDKFTDPSFDGPPAWKKVVFSSDCDDEGDCPECAIDYADCACPVPMQEDEFDYHEDTDGVLWAKAKIST